MPTGPRPQHGLHQVRLGSVWKGTCQVIFPIDLIPHSHMEKARGSLLPESRQSHFQG